MNCESATQPNFVLLRIYHWSGSLQMLQSLLCFCGLEIPLEVYLLSSKQQRNVRLWTAFAWHTFYSECCFISCWCIWCVPVRVHTCHCMGESSLLSPGFTETKLSPSVLCIKYFYLLVHLDSPIANFFQLKIFSMHYILVIFIFPLISLLPDSPHLPTHPTSFFFSLSFK